MKKYASALAIVLLAPLAQLGGPAPASAADGLGLTGRPAVATCPKGTIPVTNSDGSVTCAKITIVDPDLPGFPS